MTDKPAESSLWHRLNPFHPRPSSSLHQYISHDSADERASSIDTTLPRSSADDSDARSRFVYTPAPPASPDKHRTTSILRTLAHHPSLSALKSRSKRNRRKVRAPLPLALPGLAGGHVGQPVLEEEDDGGGDDTSFSPKKLRKQGSVKTSRSMPQNMRLSGDTTYPRSSADTDPFAHLPIPPRLPHQPRTPKLRLKNKYDRSDPRSDLIKRKPPPPTPEINVVSSDITPESVRVRRMRFQFDLSAEEISPPAIGRLSIGSSRSRSRAASTSDVTEDSPSKGRSQGARHLSSPPPPIPSLGTYASAHHPFTTQHPHPVPLTISPRNIEDQTTYVDVDHRATSDFDPINESGHTHARGVEDGLDVLVTQQEIPPGTPGGKRSDLRRGAFVDGARHERAAIRFFSRDTYTPMSPSPSPDDSPVVQQKTPISESSTGDRSESPFEVKLSALVTKRMSLDAFGAPTPPLANDADSSISVFSMAEMEEILEDEEGSDEAESDHDSDDGDDNNEMGILGVDNEEHGCNSRSSFQEGSTQTFSESLYIRTTPNPESSVEGHNPNQHPLVGDQPMTLPWVPSPNYRQHSSCPPLSSSQVFLAADAHHFKLLRAELDHSVKVIADLKAKLAHTPSANITSVKVYEEQQTEARICDLQMLLTAKEEELEDIGVRFRSQAEEYNFTIAQLRRAMEDNEGYFDTLQATHDELADRLAELETEHAELLIERAGDAQLLHETQKEIDELSAVIERRDFEERRLRQTIMNLQQQLHDAQAEDTLLHRTLSDREAQHVAAASLVQKEMETITDLLRQKQERVSELEDLLRAGLERENEIRTLTAMVKTRDERILDLEFRQTERQRRLDQSDNAVSDRETEIASLRFKLYELEGDKVKLGRDCVAAVKSISAKDTIIGVLRDKLGAAAFEKDELEADNQMLQAQAATREEGKRDAEAKLRAELEVLRKSILEAEGKREEAELELERAQQASNTIAAAAEQLEQALLKAEQVAAQIDSDKSAWQEEREELHCRLQDLTALAEDDESIHEQLELALHDASQLRQELSDTRRQLEEHYETLDSRACAIKTRDAELDYLRSALVEAEESAEYLGEGYARRAEEAERQVDALQSQLDDAKCDLLSREAVLSKALVDVETERAGVSDVKSRLVTFTAEIDRLSMAHARSQKQVEDARRGSASLDIKVAELEKTVAGLLQDKELLNVALDSKQTEVVILQRQLGQGTPNAKGRALAASTSRMIRTPNDVTPVPSRLSKSISHTSLQRSRAGSISAMSTPTPTISSTPAPGQRADQTTPRARAVVTPSPAPLGSSSRHNRAPVRGVATTGRKKISMDQATSEPVMSRRTSLPVMKGSSIDLSRLAGMGQVGEEDEGEI